VRRTALVLLVGCGRLHFDPVASDGSSDAPCVFGPFGTPQNAGALNSSAQDFGPAVSADQLTIIFGSGRGGGSHLYGSQRAAITEPFPPAAAVTELNSTNISDQDRGPTLSPDGLTVYFSSTRGGPLQLYRATRMSETALWNPPALVPELSAVGDFAGPGISADGTELFFSHTTPTTTLFHTFQSGGVFGAPIAITELSTGGVVEPAGYASLSRDGLTVFFEGDRDEAALHIYTATRQTPQGPFGAPTQVGNINVPGVSCADPEISKDGTTLWLETMGDIVSATRACQ
jgi:Tol biopolymer transport system component